MLIAVHLLANAEGELLSQAVRGVATGGPIAALLALICWKVWAGWTAELAENKRLAVAHAKELADLNKLHADRVDKLQAKMLRLAVRVQRAVEALAGLEAPEIEQDLIDGD